MALNVNISINNPGLVDRNKLEAAANRQVTLVDKEEQKRVEAKSEDARRAELEKRGQNPDGSAKKRSGTKIEPIPEEPIAWRSGGDLVLDTTTPPVVVVSEEWGIPDDENPLTYGPIHYFIFKDFKHRTAPSELQLQRRVYMTCRPYRQWTGCTSYSEDTIEYNDGVIKFSGSSPWAGGDVPRLIGCAITGSSELIDRGWVQDYIYNRSLTDEEWAQYLSTIRSLSVYNPRDDALGCIAEQTFYGHNCFSTGLETEPVYSLPTSFGNDAPANVDTLLSKFYKFSELTSLNFTIEIIFKISSDFIEDQLQEGSYSRISSLFLGFGDVQIQLWNSPFLSLVSRITFRNIQNNFSNEEIPLTPSSFNEKSHLAIVGKKNEDGENGTLSLFLDGMKINTFTLQKDQYVYFNEISYSGQGLSGTLEIFGLRISKKSRYQNNFTPPTQLR